MGALRPAILDGYVLARDIADLAEASAKCEDRIALVFESR
jgi:hypothetical protein